MAELEIPSYFLCPISYQIMKDPVTLPTGITYDRSSIERWIFSGMHGSCPVTNQPVSDPDPIPNHTLRRLIQAWCVAHSFERFPTPRPPVDPRLIADLADEARSCPPPDRIKHVRKLKSIASESERNRRCVARSGAALDFLSSMVTASEAVEEAVGILTSLHISDQGLIDLVARNEGLIDSLAAVLRLSSPTSRANAMMLLKSVVAVISPDRLVCVKEEVFVEIVKVVGDRISVHATKAALETLIGLCPWGRNRVKAVEAGAVHALVELLIDGGEGRRVAEMGLAVLDRLCRCAEGRAKMVGHAAGIAAVSARLLEVSSAGIEPALRVLHSVAQHSATAAVLKEMVEVRVVAKLCMMLAVGECGPKAKERAREILRMHSTVWRRSPCLSPHLQAMYPR